jgi:L-malate glycosyltransferase
MSKKLKILHTVESYFPSVSGAPEVVRQLSERMVKMGHDVTVATRKLPHRKSLNHNGVKIVEFDIQPINTHGASIVSGLKGETKKYQDFLRNGNFDVIMSYAAQQWSTDLMFGVLDEIKAKKVLVPCGYSALYDPAYRHYFQQLPKFLKKFDATVYHANNYRDIDFARTHKIKNTHVIPNGADENEFTDPLSPERKKHLIDKYGLTGLVIMTVANYTGEKGHEELLKVFKRLPVTQATLVSAGNPTPGVGSYDMFKAQRDRVNTNKKFAGKKIVMIDGSDHFEVHRLLKCADLFVFLSNIEYSPLVLFEAAAAGVPFVATNAGNSAEIAKWTGAGVIVKTHPLPNGRVAADYRNTLWKVTRLCYDPKRRLTLGNNGRKAWKEHYTWQKITGEYLKLYQSLIEKKAKK